jgi:hypothetical protein
MRRISGNFRSILPVRNGRNISYAAVVLSCNNRSLATLHTLEDAMYSRVKKVSEHIHRDRK